MVSADSGSWCVYEHTRHLPSVSYKGYQSALATKHLFPTLPLHVFAAVFKGPLVDGYACRPATEITKLLPLNQQTYIHICIYIFYAQRLVWPQIIKRCVHAAVIMMEILSILWRSGRSLCDKHRGQTFSGRRWCFGVSLLLLHEQIQWSLNTRRAAEPSP